MYFGEETLSKNQIYNGAILSLELHDVALQNGATAKREIIRHAPAVAIIAITDQQEMVFVRQFRKAIEKAILEVPAGLVDEGEELLAAAKRELAEETQLAAAHWQELDCFYVTPGYNDEYIQMFSCSDLSQASGTFSLDDDEHVEMIKLSFEEAQQAIKSGEICDAKTIYAIQYWQLQNKG